jgi:hypothetical protein
MIRSILIGMRYQPGHKAAIHQKILKDAAQRVRTEGLNGAAAQVRLQAYRQAAIAD